MDQQQSYVISLIAVFLALGIGILVGAAMGENALVTNQMAVIEELNNEVRYHKEENESRLLSVARLEKELSVWRSLEEEYLNPLLLEDKMKSAAVKIIVQDNLPANLADFLELGGCSYQAFIFTETSARSTAGSEEKEEDILLLEAGSSLPISDPMELILSENEESPAGNLLYKFAERNMLWVQTKQNDETAPEIISEEDQRGEYFIAYGPLSPFCLELLHKIEREGKTVLRVDVPGGKQGVVAEREPVSREKFTLGSFYGKLKLLEFLQASK